MVDDIRTDLVTLFGEAAEVEHVATITEAPWRKDPNALATVTVSVIRFGDHGSGITYVTSGLGAPSCPQKSVAGAKYEVVFCVPVATVWAPRLVLDLAQLSLGYELTGFWEWSNLRKCAVSMGHDRDFGRPLRDAYDGLRFVSYRLAGAERSGTRMRLRLAVGADRHESTLSDASFTRGLKRHGFWPVTPARRANLVDLDAAYVPPTDKRTEKQMAADARSLVNWLIERGELIVVANEIDALVARFVPELRRITSNDEGDDEPARVTLAFLEDDPAVDELFIDEPIRDTVEWRARVAQGGDGGDLTDLERWFDRYGSRHRR